MARELDIVVISDVHLGTYGCHAKELLNYLDSIKVSTLILNGDFIDLWKFRKKYFPQEHMEVIQRVLTMAANGTKVFYIIGDRDDALRQHTDFSSGNVHLRDRLLLTLKGKSYCIFHGDIFDLLGKYSPTIWNLSDKAYQWLIFANRLVNKIKGWFVAKTMAESQSGTSGKSSYNRYQKSFEDTAINLAVEQSFDYIVCGHIHAPQMRTLDAKDKKVTYLNSGDWQENLTALEYKWGRWSIYEYDQTDYELLGTSKDISKPEIADQAVTQQIFSAEQFFETLVKRPLGEKTIF